MRNATTTSQRDNGAFTECATRARGAELGSRGDEKRGLGSKAPPGAKLGAFGGLSFQTQALRGCLARRSGECGMGRLGLRWRMVEHGRLWGLLSVFCAVRLREVRARRSTYKIANAPKRRRGGRDR